MNGIRLIPLCLFRSYRHGQSLLIRASVTLDIGAGDFVSRSAYIALSRCRSLEGIRLHSRIRPTDIKVDPHTRQFYLGNIQNNSH